MPTLRQEERFLDDTYDGILIGAGHNALVLQSYLGQAGLKTLCIERRAEPGGGLSTFEDPRHPGFLHNTHSFFHRALTDMPWYRDLELERHGARYIEPDLNAAMILSDGRLLEWWTDFDKTVEAFSRFSRKDAATLQRWRDAFVPVLEKVLVREQSAPPVEPDRRNELLGQFPEGRLLLETSMLSPQEFVLREFEHPAVQAGLLFFNGLREVDLRCRGFGHHIPALLASDKKAQMCIGGSASLADALVSAVRSGGGDILLNTEPTRILVENGRASGVQTSDGNRFQAREFVASSLNPQQTFVNLMAPEDVSASWREAAARFQYNSIGPLFGLNTALREPPRYTAALEYPHLAEAFMVIVGLDSYDTFPEIVRHHESGTIPPTVMWGASPTVFDPTQAPPGRHTAFMWEKLPYSLGGNPHSWDSERDGHGQAMLDVWRRYAPNMEEAVIDWFARSPLDTERTFPNMHRGDLLVGSFAGDQIGFGRPFRGAGRYRGDADRLYLCGSSSHPGGNITGLPGYNCAQVIYRDLGLVGSLELTDMESVLEVHGRHSN
ncbi:NAD(P)/FAD-dependent oxidoreductase [soil metagenome]